ncbi:GAF domain-containing protein [Streptomyces paromomycinus]|uniref:Transcriptional regulator n=1 Tax=Streptomyces paromomycinus TaxID=92743 RepID=A0A401W6B1_STREY|nr:GAF domain-containing protein [Streptomyces paromomycinus]GCD44795.1 transcriptional regulator [Streptomyces paromomycinus]
MNRRAVAYHLAAVEMQEAYARRLGNWSSKDRHTRPLFMDTVVTLCGADGASIVLLDADLRQLAVAFSDRRARKAQDLEYVLGEGPAHDAVRSRFPVIAAGTGLLTRWPGYGREISGLGLRVAAAVPLTVAGTCFGALAVYDRRRPPQQADLDRAASALIEEVMLGPDGDPLLYGDIDQQIVVHQATGMVSAREGCSLSDALALIKARAFVKERTADEIAHQVVHSRLRLSSDPD